MPSLSGVANRYIALSPGPNNYPALRNGAVITKTSSPVDLDELFNTLNPATRKGLQQVIEGFALEYAGVEGDVNASVHYFPSTLRALSHVFGELTRDEKTFSEFLAATPPRRRASSARKANRSRTSSATPTRPSSAIGSEQHALTRGLTELPNTFTAGHEDLQRNRPDADAR